MKRPRKIEDEQAAFNAVLATMMETHAGEFVVFHQGEAAGYFETYDQAYADALDRFGLDDVYLVSEVVQRRPEAASISWDLGVLFGQ